MDISTIFMLLIGFILVYAVSKSIYIVRQSECIIVERLGKFNRILGSGLNIMVPFLDLPRNIVWSKNGIMQPIDRVELREVVMDVPEQRVITKDNVGILVDALIYVQITDPVRAAYEIQSLPMATSQLTQTSLRSLIGEMELDNTLASRDVINARLKAVLDEATDKWGLKVNRVELKNIIPPADVQQAMEKQMQAERERRAQVLSAEGAKQSGILVAEGEKIARIQRSEGEQQEKINQAQGDMEAAILRSEGQAKSIEAVAQAQAHAANMVKEALGSTENTLHYLVAMEYLKAFSAMTQKNSDKIFIPFEATGVLSSLGSIKEMLQVNSAGKQAKS